MILFNRRFRGMGKQCVKKCRSLRAKACEMRKDGRCIGFYKEQPDAIALSGKAICWIPDPFYNRLELAKA